MKRIDVVAAGVIADGKTSCSELLTELFAANKTDTEFYFSAGKYYLDAVVKISGAQNFRMIGDGATVLTHFTATGDTTENNNAFEFFDCHNVEVKDFTFTTDNHVNCAGRIIATDVDNTTYDVKIDDAFPMTGWEHLWGSNTCDEEGTPNYHLDTYDQIIRETIADENGNERLKISGVRYTLLENNVIRVDMSGYGENARTLVSRLYEGERILYRYIIYGNSVFSFSNCHDVALRNIEIERCSSMGAHVSPRSSNFTFENFNIRLPKDTSALYSANADGIHILGLSGYLKMKDCTFVGLGDDALNIHGLAARIESIREDGAIECIRRTRKMANNWAEEGDVLIVYDHDTLIEKGRITVKSYEDGFAVIADHAGEYGVGDVLANDAYFASVELENCEVRHTRARGFLLQSRDVTVDHCRVYGMALPAIIVAPDVNYWYEVGPSDNVEIRNCHFEKCAQAPRSANLGAVVVKASHDSGFSDHPAGVHTNMRLIGNTFKRCGNSGIYVTATKGLEVRDNHFENCSCKRFDNKTPGTDCDISVRNSENITVSGNVTSKDPSLLVYVDNCVDVTVK